MALKERARRARELYDLGFITSRNSSGLARTVVIPGRRARLHMVILKWGEKGVIETECFLMAGNQKDLSGKCKGNHQTVCYHVMAAVNLALSERDLDTGWSTTASDARRLKNLHEGGRAFVVVGHGGKSLYVTAWEKGSKKVERTPYIPVVDAVTV